MVEINRKVWLVLDVVGIVVLLIGAVGFIGLLNMGETASIVTFGIGLFLVIESAIFIYQEGLTIRAEIMEIERHCAIIEAAATVSDDSDVGYILDLTESHAILSEESISAFSEVKGIEEAESDECCPSFSEEVKETCEQVPEKTE